MVRLNVVPSLGPNPSGSSEHAAVRAPFPAHDLYLLRPSSKASKFGADFVGGSSGPSVKFVWGAHARCQVQSLFPVHHLTDPSPTVVDDDNVHDDCCVDVHGDDDADLARVGATAGFSANVQREFDRSLLEPGTASH